MQIWLFRVMYPNLVCYGVKWGTPSFASDLLHVEGMCCRRHCGSFFNHTDFYESLEKEEQMNSAFTACSRLFFVFTLSFIFFLMCLPLSKECDECHYFLQRKVRAVCSQLISTPLPWSQLILIVGWTCISNTVCLLNVLYPCFKDEANFACDIWNLLLYRKVL